MGGIQCYSCPLALLRGGGGEEGKGAGGVSG